MRFASLAAGRSFAPSPSQSTQNEPLPVGIGIPSRMCGWCGRPARIRWCCNACKCAAGYAMRRPGTSFAKCLQCGEAMWFYRSDAKYCGVACRSRACRLRRNESGLGASSVASTPPAVRQDRPQEPRLNSRVRAVRQRRFRDGL